jgi:protein-disulfide isomerase
VNTRFVSALAIAALLAALPLSAAQASKEDVEALKKQIQDLATSQAAIQKQLEEIRTLLKERPAAAAAPAPAPPSGPAPGTMVNTASAPVEGDASAKVTIVEFSDFQCPFCARFHTGTLPQIQKEYVETGKVRHVFRNLPLEAIHPMAFKASEAALCAGDQDKYWEMHNLLFQNQRALAPEQLVGYAKTLGLDAAAFQSCLDSGKQAARIRTDLEEAGRLGLNGTPAFVIGVAMPDGKVKTVKFVSGARPYADFKAAIDAALAMP